MFDGNDLPTNPAQRAALEAYARTLPPGPMEVRDTDLLERQAPDLSDKEAAERWRRLQVEQLLRDARRTGFL